MENHRSEFIELQAVLENLGPDKVRMKWTVRNHSDKSIRVLSYYCSFFEGHERRGVYVRGKWVQDEFERTDEHIRVHLYPEEERTYVWAWVHPAYYGIVREGEWHYELNLRYTVDDETEVKTETASSEKVYIGIPRQIPDRLGPFTSPSIIQALVDRFPGIRDFQDRGNTVAATLSVEHRDMQIDAVLQAGDKLVVVETANYVTNQHLERVRDAMERLQNYARRKSLNVTGVIVALEVKASLREDANRQGISILEMQIPNYEP